MKDSIAILGIITLRLFGPDGRLKQEQVRHNVFTNYGRSKIVDLLQGGVAITAPDYIAIGTGTNAAAATDTALQTEVARAQGTLTQPDAYTDKCVYTFGAGVGTGSITEVGRIDAASSGNLFGRSVDTAIPKGALDTLEITYNFTYAAS